MRTLPANALHYIPVPSNWKNLRIDGRQVPVDGIATYYKRIVTKKSPGSWGLAVGNITSAYKVWVNGKPIGEAGHATATPEGFRPIYLPATWYFETSSDTLDIVLHVSNFFDVNYAGVSQRIFLGNSQTMEQASLNRTAISIFILSTLILLFLFQLTIGFVYREEKSHFIIALLSILAVIKMLLDGNVVIFHFLPLLSFTACYRIWLLSFLCIPLVYRLTRISFPQEMNAAAERITWIIYVTLTAVFLTFHLHFIMQIIFPIIYLSILFIGYLLLVFVKAVLHKKKYSVLNLIGFGAMVLTIFNDLIYVTNQSTAGYMAQSGVCFYLLVQSYIVSLKFARSHRQVIVLSHELEEINRNLELTVAKRTEELSSINDELAKVNKQKDFFISSITHDLIGSFNVLITFTKSLSQDTNLPEKYTRTMHMLHRTSERGYNILDNILSWARLQIGQKAEMEVIGDFNSIVESNTCLFSDKLNAKSVDVSFSIDNALRFRCNESHLNTMLRNLISNAIKFSHPGGMISIVNRRENDMVVTVIHDNGTGIDEETLKTIFDTDKPKNKGTAGEYGAGIGLIIVRELAANNNGTVSCRSAKGYGTDFLISFPALQPL
jgi:signal transduction histidine kinase